LETAPAGAAFQPPPTCRIVERHSTCDDEEDAMGSAPMEEPFRLSCGDQELAWDRIAKIWTCRRCGASLSYVSWSCGRRIECRAEATDRPASLAVRRFRHCRP